jgi:DNA-binding beta-propeller fold protein YncE
MRRVQFWAVAATILLVLAGCAGLSPRSAPESAPEDVLFVRTAGGVTLVRDLPEGVAIRLSGAVPSTDWSSVVRAIPSGRETRVVALETSSGAELWSRDVQGTFEVKVASENGRLVALGAPREGTGYPDGRSSTTLVLVGEDGSAPRTIQLEGNFEPEAFSTDGGSLFVIEYRPPLDPTSYRVRRLDLGTGEVVGVYTPDADLQRAMEGTARVQAASPDGRRLYTLYSQRGTDGTRHAFIHVLSLDQLWAHCIDLPAGFGAAPEEAIALSLAPDGTRLYVADARADSVAEVDTQALSVARSTQVDFGTSGAPAHATRGADGMLYLASGARLLAVDPSTLVPGRSWDLEEEITGIQAAKDGSRLYVGLRDRIVVLDTASGGRLGVLTPADMGKIGQLGLSTRLLDEERKVITCAC